MTTRRWITWAKHFAVCGTLVFVGALVLPIPEAFRVGAAFYLLREVEQQSKKWRGNTVGDWVGAFGDVGSAWAGAGIVWWLL